MPNTRRQFPAAVLGLALLSLAPLGASAAPAAAAPAAARTPLPAAPELSLVTILPGTELYSAFGHSAIRYRDPYRGIDVMYNYGISAKPFDLAFALGMLAGKMPFLAARLDTERSIEFYREVENRTILEQPLLLGPEEGRALLAELETAVRPENSTYNYRYFSDNCATRIWVLLAKRLDGESLDRLPRSTEREALHEALGPNLWLRSFLDFIVGPEADRRPAGRPSLFLPIQIEKVAETATVAGPGAPLAGPVETLYRSTRGEGSNFFTSPLAASSLALLLLALLSWWGRGRLARVLDLLLYALLALLGLIVLLFWLSAGYKEVAWNLNLLWASPLPLLAWFLERGRATAGAAKILYGLAAAGALLLALFGGLGIQVLPAELRLLAAGVALRCGTGLLGPRFGLSLPRPSRGPAARS